MDKFNISPESFDPDIFDLEDEPVSSLRPDAEPVVADDVADQPSASRVNPDKPAAVNPRKEPSTDRKRVAQPSRRRPAAPAPTAANGRQKVALGKSVKNRPNAFVRFFGDPRTRIFFGILLGLITVYMLVVTISYFAEVAHDQSSVLSNTFAALAESPETVSNAGGPLGAWLSEMIISQWMGVGSFIMIFYIGMVSLALLKVRKIRFWPFTMRCLLTTVAVSVVLGLVTYETSAVFYWGGRHGHFFNESMVNVAGIWGAVCVSVLMVAMVAILFFKTLHRGFRKLRVILVRRRHRMMLERAAAEEERRLKAEQDAREAAAAAAAERMADQAVGHESTPVQPSENESSADADDFHNDLPEVAVSDDMDDVIPVVDDDEMSVDDRPVDLDIPDAIVTLGGMLIESPKIESAEISSDEPLEKVAAETDLYDPRLDLSHYVMPSLDLLVEREQRTDNVDAEEQEENQQRITKTLLDYGIPISSIKATVGPTVTLYEIVPAEGIRIAKIKRLEDDIALSLAALGIRIIAPIPGKGTIGIEVPNKDPQTVSIRSILGSKTFLESRMELPMAMGCTISNEVFMADLTKMPHLLVAGATGMGKSVGLNTIIASLLYKKHPAELKFVLVDPKMVEFSLYARLERHYLAKLPGDDDAIITDTSKVVATLNSLCKEMDDRYTLLKNAHCRTIKEYNDKFVHRTLNPDKGHRYLPYIVVIVDEFADLIMTAGKEVETPIARIAQKARAVGIHMILATQRPSANIITGVIKANFPGRIAFRVFQMVDSRTILDSPGANQLIGKGDMLFSNNGKKERVQCAFIDTPEVEAICAAIDSQQGYDGAYELPEYVPDDIDPQGMGAVADRDTLFEEVARYVVMGGTTASTSSIQRRYQIGYNRAGRIMDQLESAGVVGPAQGGKPRQVLIDSLQLERLLEIPV